VPYDGKQLSGVTRGKKFNRAMLWKTIIWCNARENIQPVPCYGKQSSGVMRGKTFNLCHAMENNHLV